MLQAILLLAMAALPLASAQIVVFENVAVVPMDRERILTNQTVVVSQGRIAAMGPRESVKSPEGAVRIQADNQYFLIPGLADMHVHVRYETDLPLLVANGVTLVRNMRGSPFHLKLRARIASGELLGPRIITAGAQLRGWDENARSPQEARELVDQQAAAGYDFIKVYDGLTKEAYAAIVEEARARHLPVAGHVPTSVGVEGVLAAHQASIEHAEQYVYHCFGDPDHFDLDYAKIPAIAAKAAAAGTYVTPTLTIIGSYVLQVEDRAKLLGRPEIRFTHPETYAWWWTSQTSSSSLNRILYSFQKDLIKGFRAAGVKMLAGTDFYAIGLLPGYGLHRELDSLVEAGLTPYQTLEAATRNPAEFLGELDKSGTIVAGKNADLVLVNGNPLDDISNVHKIVGVVVRGRWLPAAELDGLTGEIAKSFEGEQRLVDSLLAGSAAADPGRVRFQESTLSLVGGYFEGLKRYQDAIHVYQLITQAYPNSADAWESLGDGYAASGKKLAAKESYERALKLEPGRKSTADKLNQIH